MKTGLIPMHHGWLVDTDGAAIDPTWPELDTQYFGISFTKEEHGHALVAGGHWSMFDLPFAGTKILMERETNEATCCI